MENNYNLLAQALQYVGVREIPGKGNNPLIVEWSQSVLSWVRNDEVPWCSSYMNAMADKAGLEKTGKANARSWLQVGTAVTSPLAGDVVIFWRSSPKSWKGHVGIFCGFSGDYILVLGGNQNNQVSIAKYHKSRLLGYRRLQQKQ